MQTITVTNPNKRINIISKQIEKNGVITQQSGILMRTTRSLAAKLINTGTHTVTSKSKLKSFLNKSSKLHKNNRTMGTMIPVLDKRGNYVLDSSDNPKMKLKYDLEDKKAGHKVLRDQFSGKIYALLLMKQVPMEMVSSKEIDPMTGGKKVVKMIQDRYQTLVLQFPNY